jgi:hypothetical protein
MRDGHSSWCRECHAAAVQRWRTENPEKGASYNLARRVKHGPRPCAECGEPFVSGVPTRWELFALEWTDIDLASHRIHVRRRLYRGELDLPKSNRERTTAVPPPARDALLRQPTRHLPIVFASKTGKRLSAPTLTGYWGAGEGGIQRPLRRKCVGNRHRARRFPAAPHAPRAHRPAAASPQPPRPTHLGCNRPSGQPQPVQPVHRQMLRNHVEIEIQSGRGS